jgi:hypothetical protein
MNGTSLWDAVAAMDFQAFQLPGASGRSPRHLEFLANPHIGGKLKVRVMYHSDTLPAGSHLPDASSKFGKGDSALDVIGTITDGWNSFTPFAAQLLELALAPYEQIGCTPGQMFKDSSTRGKSSSAAMGLPLNRAREAFELAVSIVASEKAPAIVAMRFVKSTRAILGFTRFSPVTAILEVDGAFSSGTTMAQQAVWAELAARNIPFTFHWGKVNNLDALSVRRCYGEERVRRWIDSRHKLLDTPELRRVFSNMFTDRLGLSD